MPTLLLNRAPVSTAYNSVQTTKLILNIDVQPAEGEKYVSYEDCKRIIAGKFPSITKYSQYVDQHNLYLLGLPKYPSVSYADKYEGVEIFLGGSASEQAIVSSKYARANREQRKKKITTNGFAYDRTPSTIKPKDSVDMAVVCKYLADRKMLDVLNFISNHKNMNICDARIITKFLINLYNS